MSIKNLIYILIAGIFLSSCGLENPVSDVIMMNSPKDLKAYPGNHSITIQFSARNPEENFRGYNIYVNFISNVASADGTLTVVSSNSVEEPTYSLTPFTNCSNFTYTFNILDSKSELIENFQTYYIVIAAYSYGDSLKLSPYSNEVKTTPRLESTHLYSIKSEEYFDLFNQQNIAVQSDADFQYKITNNIYYIIPVASDISIQNIGYYDDWNFIGGAPDNGYLAHPVAFSISNVFMIKKTLSTNSFYIGEIFIHNINLDQSIDIYWAIQKKENCLDI